MFGEQQGIQNVKTTIIKRALQTLLLSATLSLSATHAAEQTITIQGELLFASLPQLGDYQGPLAEPLLFTATITEDAELAEPAVFFGLSQEYLGATRSLQMQIATIAGEVLYDESVNAQDFAFAAYLELYSLFAYDTAATSFGYPSGSAFWALISGGEERFVDREISLGADLLSRGVGMASEASISSLFAETAAYPVLATGDFTYAFLYYDQTINNLTGEGYQGIAQGVTTSVSYGGDDFSLDSVVSACGDSSSCAMKLIQSWRKQGEISVHEANSLRKAFQANKRP